MKCKKFLALVMSAVLSVSMLAGCGGGSSGVSGSVSNSQVNSLLADAEIQVDPDSSLNVAVRNAAKKVVETGSPNSFANSVATEMRWRPQDILGNLLSQLLNGLIVGPNVTFGLTSYIEEDRLVTNQGSGSLVGQVGSNAGYVRDMAPINTPEKYAASLVLAVDNVVGKLTDLTNGAIRTTYSVSGTKAKTADGTVYWVFAAQITIA